MAILRTLRLLSGLQMSTSRNGRGQNKASHLAHGTPGLSNCTKAPIIDYWMIARFQNVEGARRRRRINHLITDHLPGTNSEQSTVFVLRGEVVQYSAVVDESVDVAAEHVSHPCQHGRSVELSHVRVHLLEILGQSRVRVRPRYRAELDAGLVTGGAAQPVIINP